MAVFQDGAGLTYTAASQEAVDKYAHMIRGYLGMTRDVGDRLKDVLAADGEMPMAVAANLGLSQMPLEVAAPEASVRSLSTTRRARVL